MPLGRAHFHYAPGGTEADSFLVLGDGTALSVQALRQGDYPLADVDLLALSACQTAMGSPGADGSEVEGLAVVAAPWGALHSRKRECRAIFRRALRRQGEGDSLRLSGKNHSLCIAWHDV